MSLDYLKNLHSVMNELSIDYWVMGGYAVELAVGRLTREHDDVDVLVKLSDLGAVISELERQGFVIDYERDKVIATKDSKRIDLISLEEVKGEYVIPVLNAELRVPKALMKPVKSNLKGKIYQRVPNEVIYLLTRYSPNESDVLIAENLQINSSALNQIRINLKKRMS